MTQAQQAAHVSPITFTAFVLAAFAIVAVAAAPLIAIATQVVA
jgi:hypothetical protein